MAVQISRGMAHIAAQGITHGALTTKSVMLNKQRVCKLTNLGQPTEECEFTSSQPNNHRALQFTHTQHLRWAALEVMHGEDLNTESDVWAYVGNILALRHAVRRRYVTSSALHYNHHTLPTVDDRKLTGFIEAGNRLTRPAQCTEVLFGILVS